MDSLPFRHDGDPHIRRNARYGLRFFFIYTAFYVAFMILNTFAPWMMEREMIGGLNLAVTYGLGLIAAAFVLALLYAWMCRARSAGDTTRTEPRH